MTHETDNLLPLVAELQAARDRLTRLLLRNAHVRPLLALKTKRLTDRASRACATASELVANLSTYKIKQTGDRRTDDK